MSKVLKCSSARLALIAGIAMAQTATDGHQRMLSVLEDIKQRSATENPYFDFDVLEREQSELASLAADAPTDKRYLLTSIVGKHELRLGRNREAVEHLLEAYDLWTKMHDSAAARIMSAEPLLQVAIAYLRLGETTNCVHGHNPESCILPIRGGGIHQHQQPARKAIEYLTLLLKHNPENLTARWLLNIAYMTVGGYPLEVPQRFVISQEAFASEEPFPRFPDVAHNVGLDTFNLSGGVIADDFDNDGFLDIVTSDWSPAGQLHYFHNNGDGTFSDRTEEAGLKGIYGGLNLVQADYDNDGNIDIFVMRGAWLGQKGRLQVNSLLRNEGRGHFRDVTFEAGLGDVHYPTQTAAWADYDNDGYVDLYVGAEGLPCQLFHNNRNGTFTDVAKQAGVENGGITKGVTWGDYNGDRFPDLYVSNLGGHNRLYRNNGDGTFTDVAPQLGVTRPFKSFAAWFWDFNNDGNLDIFVASFERKVQDIAADYLGMPVYETEPNCLYQGDGKGAFREVAAEQNLTRLTDVMGSNFGDLDNDGYPDFYLGTGYPEYEALMPNLLFHNRRGKGFANVTADAGVGHLQKGHGVAFADLDNDGDQDLYIVLGGAYAGDGYWNALFENPGFGNHWITLKLVGTKSNRCAIGARIRAEIREDGVRRSVYKWVNSGGSFGANPLRQQIGLGKASKIDVLEIFWPTSNQTQRFHGVAVDQFVEINEGQSELRELPWKTCHFRHNSTPAHH
jgi:hypothetical protein